MNLEQFIAKMQTDLKTFEKMWKDEHQKRPEDFPMDLGNEADWDEQFGCWQGNQ